MSEEKNKLKDENESEIKEEKKDENQEKAEEKTENQPKNEENEVVDKEQEESQRYMRLMAEFQNFKKRTEKEKKDIYAFANEKIIVELLDVIDNFERGLQHSAGDEKVAEGMNNLFKMFKSILEKNGLKEIDALGKEFDPKFHNAVMTGESEDYKSGEVMEVLQKGYMLKDKVVRPTMVKVVN